MRDVIDRGAIRGNMQSCDDAGRTMTLPSRYTGVAMTLHWVVAVLMIGNVALGWLANVAPDAAVRPMIDTHKSIGITVLGLAILRLLWRLTHTPPPMPASYSRAERFAAHAVHWGLYALIFALPISGWLHDSAFKLAAAHPLKLFWLVPIPRLGAISNMALGPKEQFHSWMFGLHVWLGYLLYALFALHVAGALKHQWLDREAELQRMLPD
jgi:cytochrome b561